MATFGRYLIKCSNKQGENNEKIYTYNLYKNAFGDDCIFSFTEGNGEYLVEIFESVNISKTNLVYHIFAVFTRGKSDYPNFCGKRKKTLLFSVGVI